MVPASARGVYVIEHSTIARNTGAGGVPPAVRTRTEHLGREWYTTEFVVIVAGRWRDTQLWREG
jgi:hypothetical protein